MIPEIGMIGEQVNLLIRQGGTFGPFRLTLKNPDGSPVILTDAVFRGQIRRLPSDLVNVATFSFMVTDPLNGKVEFELDAIQSAALEAGLTTEEAISQYFYDIEYVNEENRVLPLIYGNVKVFREVTK